MADKKENATSLLGKLVEIAASIGPVSKAKRNEHFHYNYTSEGQLLALVRPKLYESGIMIVTSVEEISSQPTMKGDVCTGHLITVKTVHTLHDVENKEQMKIQSVGMGWDSGDKGVYKAITGAVKYMLMKLFLVTDEQDPESGDQRPPESGPKQQRHSRGRPYEQESTKGNSAASADLDTLRDWLKQQGIDEPFVIGLAIEKKLAEKETELDDLRPGTLRRLLASKPWIESEWSKATKKGGSKPKEEKPAGESTGRSQRKGRDETDQRRPEGARVFILEQDMSAQDYLEQEGFSDWHLVEIHFGKQKGKALGEIKPESLKWWIENWEAKQYRGKWEDDTLLLDAALCVAHGEMLEKEGG